MVLGMCPEGQQKSKDGSSCEDCPLNTYKSTLDTSDCLPCGHQRITDEVGATSVQECKRKLQMFAIYVARVGKSLSAILTYRIVRL